MPETNAVIHIVDDDKPFRTALRRLLRSMGFCVETFGSASDFAETFGPTSGVLKQGRIDAPGCLILDVRMPGTSGLELQEQLIASGVKIPIVFMTAYEDPQARDQAMGRGAVAFLQKPFDDQSLRRAIDSALKQDVPGSDTTAEEDPDACSDSEAHS